MNLYDIWPYFIVVGVVLGLLARPVWFRFLDVPSGQTSHEAPLDGLRGILALSVFIHHAIISYAYVTQGRWELPPSQFYTQLGQSSVGLFFIMSAYLFWGKVLREGTSIRWSQLYVGRVFRIVPMYVVAITSMLAIIMVRADFTLREPLGHVIGEFIRWLGFGFFRKPDINGYADSSLILAGVTWTLYYEWILYFSLRLTYYASRPPVRYWFVFGGWVLFSLITFWRHGGAWTYTALFFTGMAIATLRQSSWCPVIKPIVVRIVSLTSLAAVFVFFPHIQNGLSVCLLGLFFYGLCAGENIFGLLTARATQRLGQISYSVYIMQGIALTLFYAVPAIRGWSVASPLHYWGSVLACGILLVVTSTATYALIEAPYIRIGRNVGGSVARHMEAVGGLFRRYRLR